MADAHQVQEDQSDACAQEHKDAIGFSAGIVFFVQDKEEHPYNSKGGDTP